MNNRGHFALLETPVFIVSKTSQIYQSLCDTRIYPERCSLLDCMQMQARPADGQKEHRHMIPVTEQCWLAGRGRTFHLDILYFTISSRVPQYQAVHFHVIYFVSASQHAIYSRMHVI